MRERTEHTDLPEQCDIEEAIYQYIATRGNRKFGALVEPMADHFQLKKEQRDRKTLSGEGVWYHCCNSACQSLVKDERLERINGYYRLTVKRAVS